MKIMGFQLLNPLDSFETHLPKLVVDISAHAKILSVVVTDSILPHTKENGAVTLSMAYNSYI